jgi:hypothetical protein
MDYRDIVYREIEDREKDWMFDGFHRAAISSPRRIRNLAGENMRDISMEASL